MKNAMTGVEHANKAAMSTNAAQTSEKNVQAEFWRSETCRGQFLDSVAGFVNGGAKQEGSNIESKEDNLGFVNCFTTLADTLERLVNSADCEIYFPRSKDRSALRSMSSSLRDSSDISAEVYTFLPLHAFVQHYSNESYVCVSQNDSFAS